jgi:hypothetical protein
LGKEGKKKEKRKNIRGKQGGGAEPFQPCESLVKSIAAR